jgi:hypothetical protein
MAQIAQHLGCPVTMPMPTVYNATARTFRQGKVDGWKDSLDKGLVDYLVGYCEVLCGEAGY